MTDTDTVVIGRGTETVLIGGESIEVTRPSVDVVAVGGQGPPGAQGIQGPQGSAGPSGTSHRHVQAIPATSWGPIPHNLGYRPAGIEIVDNTVPPRNVEAEVSYDPVDPLNKLTLTFLDPIAGEANFS